LLRALIAESAKVCVFDPAVRVLSAEFDGVLTMASDARAALAGASAAVVATEWSEFRDLSADDFALTMQPRLIIDPGRFLPPVSTTRALTSFRLE
jgi:UDP-N-acetyl-D-mannosaminuronate dehydrogenase